MNRQTGLVSSDDVFSAGDDHVIHRNRKIYMYNTLEMNRQTNKLGDFYDVFSAGDDHVIHRYIKIDA